jgi:D-alanine-D-alanine ligase
MSRIVLLHNHLPDQPTYDQLEAFEGASIIADELKKLGHDVVMTPFSLNIPETIEAIRKADAQQIFNVVDDIAGDDSLHTIAPAVLESMGFTYTGASASILTTTSDKLLTKKLLRMSDLPVLGWVSMNEAVDFSPGAAYIMKPINHDASIGISEESVCVMENLSAFRNHLSSRREQTRWDYFGEPFIDGREFWVAMVDCGSKVEVFPPAEIKFNGYYEGEAPRFITYRAKWERESYEYNHLGARFDFDLQEAPLIEELKRLALACWQALNLQGYVRLDFRVDAQGRAWIIDVNVNPYLPFHHGGLLDAAQHAGWDFSRLLTTILNQDLR